MANGEDEITAMAERMGEATRREIDDLHLEFGLRRVPVNTVTISGGGLPPTHLSGGYYVIPDEDVREWEQRTGRTFTEAADG